MQKYIINMFERETKTAGSKAKEDIVSILAADNYVSENIVISQNKYFRLFKRRQILRDILNKVEKGDTILYQYPSISRNIGEYFLKQVEKKKVNKIILIHDLESLRFFVDDDKKKRRELDFIDSFDTIIAHNKKMVDWLISNGVTKEIVNLEIFDYLNESEIEKYVDRENIEDTILFAGNLEKSKFLVDLEMKSHLTLFGIHPEKKYPSNIEYRGSFTPADLEKEMNGKFGLVWDGDSLDECSGVLGNYMKYNNPHKTSLYLSLGIPVIIWNKAALSDFILENNVGIAVGSLRELDDMLAQISESDYDVMKDNALEMSKQISSGYYTKKAVSKAKL